MYEASRERAEEIYKIVDDSNEAVTDEQKQELVELLSVNDPDVVEPATIALLALGNRFSADPVVEDATDDLVRIIGDYDGEPATHAGTLLMRAIFSDVVDATQVAPNKDLFFDLLGRDDDLGGVAEIVLGYIAVERLAVRDRLRDIANEGSGRERAGALEALHSAALEDSELLPEFEELYLNQLEADDVAVQEAAVNGVDTLLSEGIDIDEETIDGLFELLGADEAALRNIVGNPLGTVVVGDEQRRSQLIDALSTADPQVRGAAANAFHQYLFEDDADPTEDELATAAEALAETVELSKEDPWVRTNALDAIEWFVRQYPPVAEPMTPVVLDIFDEDDADPDVLLSALDAFYRIRYSYDAAGTRAARPISSLLEHQKPEIRAKALSELDGIGISYPEAVASDIDEVIRLLNDDDEDVVENAASLLDRVAAEASEELESVIPQLRTLMFEGKLDPTRITSRGEADAAADVLVGLQSEYPDRIETLTSDLFDALDADDEMRRIRAAAFLPKFIDFDDEDLEVGDWNRLLSGLADTLEDGGPVERKLAADALQSILYDVASTIRYAGDDEYDDHIEAMSRGLEQAVDSLVGALDDEAEDIGWYSMDALHSVAEYDPDLVHDHVEKVATITEDPVDDRQREDGLEFLAEVGDEYPSELLDVVPELEATLREDSAEHVDEIASILNNVAAEHPDAVVPAAPVLRDQLENPDIDAFEWAKLADALATVGIEYPGEVTPVAEHFVAALTTGIDYEPDEDSDDSESVLGPKNQLAEALENLVDSGGPDVELYATKAIAAAARENADPFVPAVEQLANILANGTEYDGLTSSGDEASDRIAKNWAAFALAATAYRKPEAVVDVADTVAEHLDDDQPLVRSSAVRTIAFVAEHDPETISEDAKLTTLYLLEDDRPMTRQYACLALGGMEATMAETELKKIARTDDNEDVRRAAEAAVELLSGETDDAVVDIDQSGDDIGISMSDPNEEFSL